MVMAEAAEEWLWPPSFSAREKAVVKAAQPQ